MFPHIAIGKVAASKHLAPSNSSYSHLVFVNQFQHISPGADEMITLPILTRMNSFAHTTLTPHVLEAVHEAYMQAFNNTHYDLYISGLTLAGLKEDVASTIKLACDVQTRGPYKERVIGYVAGEQRLIVAC